MGGEGLERGDEGWLAEQVRAWILRLADRSEPWLRRLGDHRAGAEAHPPVDWGWCPVCALSSLLPAQAANAVPQCLEGVANLLSVLREALVEGAGGPANDRAHRRLADAETVEDPSIGRRVQRIRVHLDDPTPAPASRPVDSAELPPYPDTGS
jgi:hypothetical protein